MRTRPLVLAIDDDDSLRRVANRLLTNAGFDVELFESADSAWERLSRDADDVDAVLTDLNMPGMDGIELVVQMKARWPALPVIVMTGNATIKSAVEAMRRGAYDYIEKPFRSPDVLDLTLTRAVEHVRLGRAKQHLENELQRISGPSSMIGRTPRIRDVFQLINAVAPTDATVLVLGESGTGKELVARALHDASPRRAQPFVPINCSALPDTLLESELFGYVRGAFTGAVANRAGLFEQASGGTLFLDEVGDVSPAMQVRLLRVLQDGEIKPVGASEIRKVDVRIVAATNRDLQAAMRAGSFREDLFFRINVLSIELPSLRQRADDIPLLAQHFLGRYSKRFRKDVVGFDAAALQALVGYDWPGNVRELENAVQRAVVLSSGDTISVDLFSEAIAGMGTRSSVATSSPSLRLPFVAARTLAVGQFERSYLEKVLTNAGGNMALAARNCQVDKSNFRRLIRKHKLNPARFKAPAS